MPPETLLVAQHADPDERSLTHDARRRHPDSTWCCARASWNPRPLGRHDAARLRLQRHAAPGPVRYELPMLSMEVWRLGIGRAA
jgi:hypothetical protein